MCGGYGPFPSGSCMSEYGYRWECASCEMTYRMNEQTFEAPLTDPWVASGL